MKRFLAVLFILLVLAALLPINVAEAQDGGCELEVGSRFEVVFSPAHDPLVLRNGPGTNYEWKRDLIVGDAGIIAGGPTQAEGYTWWQVIFDDSNQGFVAAGNEIREWIEVICAAEESEALPRQLTGQAVEVIYSPVFDRLNLRTGPGLDFVILAELDEGDDGVILDGVVKNDGYDWWAVQFSDQWGWVAAGDAYRDWLALR